MLKNARYLAISGADTAEMWPSQRAIDRTPETHATCSLPQLLGSLFKRVERCSLQSMEIVKNCNDTNAVKPFKFGGWKCFEKYWEFRFFLGVWRGLGEVLRRIWGWKLEVLTPKTAKKVYFLIKNPFNPLNGLLLLFFLKNRPLMKPSPMQWNQLKTCPLGDFDMLDTNLTSKPGKSATQSWKWRKPPPLKKKIRSPGYFKQF